jgi:hypothetical protein
MRHRPQPAGQADLAEDDRVGRHRHLGQRGDEGRGDGEVGGGLDDAQAAGDVEVDVVGADRKAAAGVEHREDHRQPGRIPADDGAARGAEQGRGDQRLDLDQ